MHKSRCPKITAFAVLLYQGWSDFQHHQSYWVSGKGKGHFYSFSTNPIIFSSMALKFFCFCQ